jgi:ribonuclease VapC
VYDSFAILKLFQKERHYQRVARLLKEDLNGEESPHRHIHNFAEILYQTHKDVGDEAQRRAIRNVIRLGFKIIPASDDLVYAAAELKGTYSISYADAFLLATASREKATIVTGDPEFKKVESRCHIEWV